MASKSSKREQIWISPRAKSILDSRKGSARKQIDELLGISKTVELTAPKRFTRPQNNLLDCFICTALYLAKAPLTKRKIYIAVVGFSNQNINDEITWAKIYEDFFSCIK